MKDRKAFNFYKSYYDVATELSDKDRLSFYDALMKRQFEGIEPKLKGMAHFAYVSQKFNIDAQIKGWEFKMKQSLQAIDNQACQGGTVGGSVQEKGEEEEKEKGEEKVISIFSFDEFWILYPNKNGKAAAKAKYDKLSEKDKGIIKETIVNFANNKPFEKYNHPMATTYINQKRWLDEVAPKPNVDPKDQRCIMTSQMSGYGKEMEKSYAFYLAELRNFGEENVKLIRML
jgi:hypothetical protein